MQLIGTNPVAKPASGPKPVVILRILQAVIVLVVLGGGYGISLVISQYNDLQRLADTLSKTSMYKDAQNTVRQSISPTNSDQKNQALRELIQKETLADVVSINSSVDGLIQSTKTYMQSMQMPYENFLHYFLLPPLNIWKNKFTGKIDDTLIGQRYLERNQYLDVNLIAKRTDFFKDIGRDSPKNEIKSATIGDIIENPNGTFTIQINVDFVAQTKRSFLLLVDKISSTSNKENIGLMNEFFFNLWVVLKEKQAGGTGSNTTGGAIVTTAADDVKLGQEIYKWVMDPQNTFITTDDIIIAMRQFAVCDDKDPADVCYFKFRQKMRNLPSLAYTLGLPQTNKVSELRNFLQNIPPLISIQSFTFSKVSAANSRDQQRGYEGSLTIQAYGRSMSQSEVDEIALYLGGICLGESTIMSPESAINQVDRIITQSAQLGGFSNERSKQFSDMKIAMQNIQGVYASSQGIQKTIKLFELYRILVDNNLCVSKN